MGRLKSPATPSGWSLTRECPGCGYPETACRCQAPAPAPPKGPLTAKLRLEKRCGKPVTVIFGLPLGDAEGKELLRALKTRCGAGGTFKAGELELQGDQREVVRALLLEQGFRVKGG
jgi:translation initiation factor 1